ncbi:Os09g0331180 [Oryza sativa Japonica Group]|uniref:Os09g0331180 protein n=1 Tax=Oryza sativa subsp. japonica TaxID=39947 RepID=C7J768_ORYSJ|nr:Os09g0331180 [Oryza sativa Japonica Group]|eukprot:NP_001175780.1 Os09g0331180 [Oryza sativa Japonica Group]
MDAKLMVATAHGDCQQLKDVVNKEDAAMMVLVMASSNGTPASAAAASPPVAMHPLLHASASSGDWKGVNFLLNREEAYADSSVQPSKKFLKSLEACIPGNCTNGRLPTPPQASNDIEEGANMPLLLSPESLLEGVTIEGDTALHVVATHGDGHNYLKCVDTICAKGKHLLFKPNNKDDTPLHCAARAGNHEMVNKLIGLAIGPSRREESVDSIANNLILRSDNLSTETFLSDDVRVADNLTVGDSISISEDNVHRGVEYLRMENDSNETALHAAIRIGHSPIVTELLTYDSELALFPQEGTSPLYLAILLKQFDIARTLYQMSRQNILSYSGPSGQNALHVAVLRSRVVREVIQANGAPLYQPDIYGMFPIHIAASVGEKRTIEIFVQKYPSSAGLRDKRGRTFLHVAVENRRVNSTEEMVRFVLTQAGAMNDSCRHDHFREKHKDTHNLKSDSESKELEKLKDATETMAIGSVLIATVTFGATFALPGGYRADDHSNGGTPTLVGSYSCTSLVAQHGGKGGPPLRCSLSGQDLLARLLLTLGNQAAAFSLSHRHPRFDPLKFPTLGLQSTDPSPPLSPPSPHDPISPLLDAQSSPEPKPPNSSHRRPPLPVGPNPSSPPR